MKWIKWIILVAFLSFWGIAATPYRFFPSDDISRFWPYMIGAPLCKYEIILGLCERCFGWIWNQFSPPTPTIIVWFALLCHLISMTAIYRASRSMPTLSLLMFAVCGWPVTYLFMASSAPLTGAFSALAIAFALCNSGWMLALSALCCVCAFGASASGIVTILGITFIVVFNRNKLTKVLGFFSALFVPMLILWAFTGNSYVEHIKENVSTPHYEMALRKFGNVPKTEMSALFILWIYSKGMLALFLAGTFIAFASKDRLLKILCASIWLQIITIQLLPSTKLGRSQFVWFPMLCMFLAASVNWIYQRERHWILLKSSVVVLLCIITIEGFASSNLVMQDKTELPRLLDKLKVKTVFLFLQDSHAIFLSQWISGRRVLIVPYSREFRLSNEHGKSAILVGPSGVGSGMSVLGNACLPDNPIGVNGCIPARYFAYTPQFCLEEEICFGLLSHGRIPHPNRDSEKNIKLIPLN